MDIHFDGQYDKKIFLQALRLVQRTGWVNRALRYVALCAALVLLSSYVYTWITEASQAGYRLVAAALLLVYAAIPLIKTWQVTGRLFSERPVRNISGRANSSGLILISRMAPGRERQILWKDFRRYGQSGQLFGLLASDGTLWVLQRSFFSSESDWNRFQQLVKMHISQPK